MADGFRQEMPPAGGYKPFEYAKSQSARFLKGKWIIGGYIATFLTTFYYQRWYRKKYVLEPELFNTEANIALEPFMLAERNRLFLMRCIDNREYEKDIMKDVPGWIPGTYYGSPIYHQKGVWRDPSPEEFWAHTPYNSGYYRQQMERHFH